MINKLFLALGVSCIITGISLLYITLNCDYRISRCVSNVAQGKHYNFDWISYWQKKGR